RAGRAVGWCFLTAVVLGAPVVCLIGAGYVTALIGGGRQTSALVAALLLALVTTLTQFGARIGTAVQMALISLLLVVIVLAVAGAAPSARTSNWTPFAPHGWTAIGGAASVLMLSFVGWEAVAPLTRRLKDPERTLPRVTTGAFVITALIYVALASTVIGVLGTRASGSVPVADLLRTAVGGVGPAVAATAAVLLTLATVNAYLTGAATLAAHLRSAERRTRSEADSREPTRRAGPFFPAVAAAGIIELTAEALGALDPARMVTLPTALFLVVYVGSTASAARILRGRLRVAAVLACAASALVFAFSGAAAVFALIVAAAGLLMPLRTSTRPAGGHFGSARRGRKRNRPLSTAVCLSDRPD
ncbi:MAG: amino acid permease, partial [Actinocrinis sp.]